MSTSIALALAAAPARADPPPLEVTVRGSSAGSFAARASVDAAPREPIDAASLLDALPSVHVRRLGAEGSFASISVRGSAPSQVGVFLGAIPLTSAADPVFDVGALPLWPGASFRVYRGFAPASLGTTGHLGGVLVIDPPSPATGERTEWWTGAGSFGGLKLRVGDLRRVNGFEIGSGFFASRGDGDFPYFHQHFPGVSPLVETRRVNAGHVAVGGVERISVERSWGTVTAIVLADARRAGVPGTVTADPPVRFASLTTTRLVGGLEASVRTKAAGALKLSAWGRRESFALDDPAAELDQTHATTTRSAIEAGGFAIAWRGRPIDALTVAAIADGRGERFVPLRSEGLQSSAPASRLAAGLGAEIEWRPLDALTVAGSARLDARRDDASGTIAGALAPTGHVGASYRFASAAVLSAHAGTVARPPSFAELYGNGASLLASPALRAERAISADVGLSGDAGDGHLGAGYELVGFASDARDLIVFERVGLATFRAKNVARAAIGGAEITAYFAARGLRMQVSYTLLLSADRDTGRPLPGRPRHDLAYDASYRFGPVRARYGIDLVSGVSADGLLPLPPRISHGAGLALDVPFAPGLRAAIDVQNLFDQRLFWVPSGGGVIPYPVSDLLNYPLPGRTFWATLRWSRSPR